MNDLISNEQIFLSILVQFVIYFPSGYLILGQKFSTVSLVIKFPFFLALGLVINLIIFSMAGFFTISNYVIIGSTIIFYGFLFVKMHNALTPQNIKGIISRYMKRLLYSVHIYSIFIFVFLIVYFTMLAGFMEWPFSHDSFHHGLLTSLLIHNQQLQTTLDPLAPSLPWFEPFGFPLLSAYLSIIMEVTPGEAMLITAATIMILICMLIYSIIYITTKSISFSMIGIVVCFYIYPFPNLERWLMGMFFTGTYPNLLSYLPLLMFIVFIAVINDKQKSKYRSALLVSVTLLGIGITYTPHIVLPLTFLILILSYKIISHGRRILIIKDKKQNKSQTAHRIGVLVIGALIFITLSIFYIDLPDLTENISNIGSLQQVKANYLAYTLNISDFTNDMNIFFIIILNILLSALSLYKRNRIYLSVFTLLYSLIMLLPSFFVSLGDYFWFILPTRLFPFLVILSFVTLLTYLSDFQILIKIVSKFKKLLTDHHLKFLKKHSNVIFSVLVIIGLFSSSVIPSLTFDHASFWGFPNPDFQNNYEVLLWLSKNTNSTDLLMTDYSFNSQFINSFSIKNITATFWPNSENDVTRAMEGQIAWANPGLIRDYIQKYDIKYVVNLQDSWGYLNPPPLGGDNLFYYKPFSAHEYDAIFNSMTFLKLVKKVGPSSVYKVL